jgi:hypothetical protein
MKYSGAAGGGVWSQMIEWEFRIKAAYRVAGWLESRGAVGWARWLRDDLDCVRAILNLFAPKVLGCGPGAHTSDGRSITPGNNNQTRLRVWSDDDWQATIALYWDRAYPVGKELELIYRRGRDSRGDQLVFEMEVAA